MKQLSIVLGICIVLSLPAAAQEPQRVQIFGGYSYLNSPREFSLNSGIQPLITSNGASGGISRNGWNASLTVNLHKNLDFVIDAGSNYQSGDRKMDNLVGLPDNTNLLKIRTASTLHTFLFGPQIRLFGEKRISPFARALFGISKMNGNYTTENTWHGLDGQSQTQTLHGKLSDTGFAFSAGGGVDMRLLKRVSWRILQVDYIRAEKQFTYDWLIFYGYTPITKDRIANNVRVASGIVINLGLRN